MEQHHPIIDKLWDPGDQTYRSTEFETFMQQIKDGQEAVALQNPYTNTRIFTIAENFIETTCFYTMDCREWNRTDNVQKTWVNFKVHFSRVFRENRDHSRQAEHIVYGHSNTQNSVNSAMLAKMTQDHNHTLANLATATKLYRTTVANMSKTITNLTLPLGQANTKLAESQSSIPKLTSKLAQTGTKPNRPTTIPTGPIDMTLV